MIVKGLASNSDKNVPENKSLIFIIYFTLQFKTKDTTAKNGSKNEKPENTTETAAKIKIYFTNHRHKTFVIRPAAEKLSKRAILTGTEKTVHANDTEKVEITPLKNFYIFL